MYRNNVCMLVVFAILVLTPIVFSCGVFTPQNCFTLSENIDWRISEKGKRMVISTSDDYEFACAIGRLGEGAFGKDGWFALHCDMMPAPYKRKIGSYLYIADSSPDDNKNGGHSIVGVAQFAAWDGDPKWPRFLKFKIVEGDKSYLLEAGAKSNRLGLISSQSSKRQDTCRVRF